MSQTVKLKRGFTINLAGKPEKKVVDSIHPETFALKPTDFIGMSRPKLLVQVGDTVKAGSPILFDKMMENVMYTAPVSGEIVEVNRGEKRKILEVVILADKSVDYETFKRYTVSDITGLSREEVVGQMTSSGVWPHLLQRPYGVVANPAHTPKAIFISTFDTSPLAPDYDLILKGQEQYFQAGLQLLSKLTSGPVHLNINAKAEVSAIFSHVNGVQVNKFSGPHPAGNVGVQIHHLDPVMKGEIAWTITPIGVTEIGKLFLEGKYDASRVIALCGSEVKTPQYYKTYAGANIKHFVEGNITERDLRFISGNPLTGERIAKDGYVGFYHSQVTVLPEGRYYEWLGWMKPTTNKLSWHRALGLLSFLNSPKKEYVLDTNTRGEERAFVQTGSFESVTPMDIYPTHLIKAIMAEDFDDMEGLGIYEVIEEDLALCEFVDVSKHEIQAILRQGIDLLRNS